MSFENICEAARNLDTQALNELLKENAYIDEWKPWTWFFSAVTQMGLENRKASVYFLLNKFNANINLAAKGAILGSVENPELLNLVEELLLKGANVNLIASFAIQVGNIEYAEALEKRFEINVNYLAEGAGLANNSEYWKKCEAREAHLSWFLKGKAKGGHLSVAELRSLGTGEINFNAIFSIFCFKDQKSQVHELPRHYVNPMHLANAAILYGDLSEALALSKGIFSEEMLKNAAMAGRREYIKKFKAKNSHLARESMQKFQRSVLYGLAAGGHARILEFAGMNQNPVISHMLISEAAKAGHESLAFQLYQLKGDSVYKALALGSAEGGHDMQLEKWADKAYKDIDGLVRGAASGNHLVLAKKYLDINKNQFRNANTLNMAAIGAAQACNPEFYSKAIYGEYTNSLVFFLSNLASTEYQPSIEVMLMNVLMLIEEAKSESSETMDFYQGALNTFLSAIAAKTMQSHPDFADNLLYQLYYLSFYRQKNIQHIIKSFEMQTPPVSIQDSVRERAIAISNLTGSETLDYHQSLYITDPQCQSLRYFFMLLLLGEQNCSGLDLDIWRHIASFIAPAPLNWNDYELLAMRDAKACFRVQLEKEGFLDKNIHPDYRHRANTFFTDISDANNKADMKVRIREAALAEKLESHPDKFSDLIESWNTRFNL